MEMITCSCGGENPNCFKCDGTGLVSKTSDQVGRPKTDFAKLAKAKQLAKREVRIVRRRVPTDSKIPQRSDLSVPSEKPVNHMAVKPDLRPYKKCPHCGKLILANRLLLHMDKAHASESRLPVSGEIFLRSACGSEFLEMQTDNEQLLCERDYSVDSDKTRTDAKSGWGRVYRDHGQFGSHPAHDDMDDESSP